MKINSNAGAFTHDAVTPNRLLKARPEGKDAQEARRQEEIRDSKKRIGPHVGELPQTLKDVNNAIGSLQTVIKVIDEMTTQGKLLSRVSREIKNSEDSDSEKKAKNVRVATDLKEKTEKEFRSALFNGENVFSRNYRSLSPDVRFAGDSLNPSSITISDPKSPDEFVRNLQTQKKYAKEAVGILEKNLNEALEKIRKDDSGHESLDRSALNASEFKNAHNTEGITLERLTKLLG